MMMHTTGPITYGMATMVSSSILLAQAPTTGDFLGVVERLTISGVLAIGCYWLARKHTEKEKEISSLHEKRASEIKEITTESNLRTERMIKALEQSNEIGRWCREHSQTNRREQ
jgi:hypothetical protein